MSLMISFLILACAAVALAGPTCLTATGSPAAWTISLKMAKNSGKSDAASRGVAYLYQDSLSTSNTFTESERGLDTNDSPVGRVMNVVYKGASKSAYIMYNDQTDQGVTSSYYGHSKGVLFFGATGGFWLIHSMPGFPDSPAAGITFGLPDSGVIYGQSYLCVSIDLAAVDTIAQQLQYHNPQIYASNLPATLASKVPTFAALLDGKRLTKTGGSNIAKITSAVSPVPFIHLAKNAKWGKNLYSDLVGPAFKTALFVETWMRPLEPSYYPPAAPHETINVASVSFTNKAGTYSWTESQDHSKWAISISKNSALVCVGDINRQASQAKRGGGTMCMVNPRMHQAFTAITQVTDKFTKPSSSDSYSIAARLDIDTSVSPTVTGLDEVAVPDNSTILVDNSARTRDSSTMSSASGGAMYSITSFLLLIPLCIILDHRLQ